MKNFNCFKVIEKKNAKEPDYKLSAKVGDEFVEIGAGWIKDTATGTKYISFSLAEPYQGKKGWQLIEEKEEELSI